MKKLLALLAVLALLLPAACVYGEGSPDLYEIYDRTEAGLKWAGNAVPILDGVVLASPLAIPEEYTELVLWDGAAYRTMNMGLPAAGGQIMVILYETDGEAPGIPQYEFIEAGRTLQAGSLLVRSGDWMQSRINRAVYDLSSLTLQGLDCLVMTLSGDTEYGSPVITEDGRLAGVIIAEYAEGINRYIALSVQGIDDAVLEASEQLGGRTADTRPEGYTVTVTDGNLATFDWSAAELPQAAEGEKVYHIVADTDNTYLTYLEATPETTQTTQALTPGRIYVSGLAPFAGAPDKLPEEYALTMVPEAEPLTDYHFQSLVFAIAAPAADAEKTALPVPVAEVTEALLRGGTACILSATSYELTEKAPDATLLITLTAPDGNNYRYASGWMYDMSLMERDEWYVSLKETGLLEMLDRDGYPEGEYELAMYIGGKLADSYRFELIK